MFTGLVIRGQVRHTMADPTSTARRMVAPSLEPFLLGIQPWLLNKAFAICRNRTDAEDLVQEAALRFLKTFANVRSLPSDNLLEAWLITTMTNCFFDQCRKRRVEKQRALDLALENMTVALHTPPKPLYDGISDEDFSTVMKKLSPALRATFELRASGLRYHEIAQAQGIPIGLVGKRLSDARRRLLEMLSPLVHAGDH
jgi:RNA polymerase sigma factor (sigma-70 family)